MASLLEPSPPPEDTGMQGRAAGVRKQPGAETLSNQKLKGPSAEEIHTWLPRGQGQPQGL